MLLGLFKFQTMSSWHLVLFPWGVLAADFLRASPPPPGPGVGFPLVCGLLLKLGGGGRAACLSSWRALKSPSCIVFESFIIPFWHNKGLRLKQYLITLQGEIRTFVYKISSWSLPVHTGASRTRVPQTHGHGRRGGSDQMVGPAEAGEAVMRRVPSSFPGTRVLLG